jgi:hypothetical protein
MVPVSGEGLFTALEHGRGPQMETQYTCATPCLPSFLFDYTGADALPLEPLYQPIPSLSYETTNTIMWFPPS